MALVISGVETEKEARGIAVLYSWIKLAPEEGKPTYEPNLWAAAELHLGQCVECQLLLDASGLLTVMEREQTIINEFERQMRINPQFKVRIEANDQILVAQAAARAEEASKMAIIGDNTLGRQHEWAVRGYMGVYTMLKTANAFVAHLEFLLASSQ